jgi:type II secretory pathway pseudopilin PulG
MKLSNELSSSPHAGHRRGFSLIEVVLAIGIFLVTVLALVGLLGPTLQSVDEVEKTDEIASVVNTVNAFLQSSPDIGDLDATPPVSKFNAIYNAVYDGGAAEGHATIFVFRRFAGATSTEVELKFGFIGETNAVLNASDFANTAGPIYRVVLTASSVTPISQLNESDSDGDGSPERNDDGIFTLANDLAAYPEGYFAMEVRIFALESDIAEARGGAVPADIAPSALKDLEPLFTYNTAVVR